MVQVPLRLDMEKRADCFFKVCKKCNFDIEKLPSKIPSRFNCLGCFLMSSCYRFTCAAAPEGKIENAVCSLAFTEAIINTEGSEKYLHNSVQKV